MKVKKNIKRKDFINLTFDRGHFLLAYHQILLRFAAHMFFKKKSLSKSI